MPRKRTKNTYWFDEQDKAIDEYNSETVEWKKQKIFNEKLHYPLFRLAEYMVNTKSSDYIQMNRDDKINWLISEMTFRLKDVNGDSNPFSYLYMTANHSLMGENMKAYDKFITHNSLNDEESYILTIEDTNTPEGEVFNEWKDLFSQIISEIEKNMESLELSKSGRRVLRTLMDLMLDANNWPLNTFKKDITNIIKHSTGYHSATVRPIINTIRPIIRRMTSNYFETGDVTKPQTIMWINRPPSPSLPKPLKNKELYEAILQEISNRPVSHVFDERGWHGYNSPKRSLLYGKHYIEEINWVDDTD